jgi:hypothetical protein
MSFKLCPVRKFKGENAPLVSKRPRPSLSVAKAMQYEEILADLEHAMKEVNAEEVHELVAQLNVLSEELRHQRGLEAYLARGRFTGPVRERIRKEYISRYVMLRGGGPTYPYPPGNGPEYSPMDGSPQPADDYLNEFTEAAVRHGFVQKVYGILFVQLLVTTLIGGLVMNLLDGASKGVVSLCFAVSLVVMIGTMCVCICRPGLMRVYPTNYALLSVFTIAESILIGYISAQYTKESVLIVAAVTAVVVLGLSVFACQTEYDFSGWGPYLLCALFVMFGLSLCFLIAAMLGFSNSPAFQALRLVFAGLGALLFSFYIIYDTQLITGGKHGSTMFSVDDYCMAALVLYMDIIQLFMYMLELFGDRK